MAGQDFANNESLRQEKMSPPSGNMKVLLLIAVALMAVVAGFGSGFYLGKETAREKVSGEGESKLLAQLKQKEEELSRLRAEVNRKKPDEAPTTQVGELTFYNELPRQSVVPAPMETEASAPSPDAVPPGSASQKETSPDATLKQIIEQELSLGGGDQKPKTDGSASAYYLQMASFQQKSEAEKFLPKVGSVGYSGSVRRVELPGKGTWYRVYAGPFSSKQAAEEARKSVGKKLNINGLVVKGG